MGDAERAERVDDGVHDRGERPNIAGQTPKLRRARAGGEVTSDPAREQATAITLPARWGVRASCSPAAAVRNPRSCYLNDPIGFLIADAPVIASLRRGAACAEAEKINKP